MSIEISYYRGQLVMVDKAQAAANNEDGDPTPAASTPADDNDAADITTAERGDDDAKTAQRRARMQEEIRAGMKRALKH